jgi:hypothetical protein
VYSSYSKEEAIGRNRIVINKGWRLLHDNRRGYFDIWGTSGADRKNYSLTTAEWDSPHIINLLYGKGTRKAYYNGIQKFSLNDTGTISSSTKPLALGGQVNDTTGDDQSESRINLSEVLIFQNRLALPDQRKIEGFLAHKWGLSGSLDASHPYKTAVPTFNDPISAVDLTLYWGPNDGGTNAAIWENNVSLGRFYAEEKVNGFSAKAYEIPASLDKTQAATDYFADINQLLALTPTGSAVIQGEPDDPNATGMDFQLDQDFQFFELGIDVGADRFMLILETDFLASTSGSYEFRSDIEEDQSMIWIDLDHNGKYERIGKAGSERLEIQDPLPGTFDDTVNLTAGKSYRMAFMLAGIGTTRDWEILYQTPGMSDLARIKPLQSSQDGLFTTTRLSNQSTGDLQTRLEANATGLVAGNTYYYRIKGANSASDWADATGTFVAESAISQTTGSLTFDTDGPTPRWSSSDGRSGTGQIITTTYLDSQSNSISYKTAKFDFNSLSIGDGVQVHLLGSNPLHLQVSGDATISATLDLNGTNALDDSGDTSELFDTLGRLGGGIGGRNIEEDDLGAPGGGPVHVTNSNQFNSGGKPFPGTGDYRASGLVGGNAAGGGSYGGIGGRPEPTGGVGYNTTTISASGKTYGVPELTHLLAGSGGGGGGQRAGGSGAGAIKIVATGTLTIGGDIWAAGGRGGKKIQSLLKRVDPAQVEPSF